MSASDLTLAGETPDVAPERRPSRLDGRGTALAAGLIFAALALLPLLATAIDDQFLLVTATRIMIFALAALSLDLIPCYGALVSFGHAAFIGLGAYSVAILAAHGIDDIL
ncbi:MAG: branched-chain amino acid ABC transporter permease, partial [Aurantimonas sp.]|nr:branched-chain amino acid ABC transporter permease [Aurantimonas sp.]